MQQTYDLIIIGGGIVGLSAALGMSSFGFSVALIDSGPSAHKNATDTRVYAINQASKRLFQELACWSLISDKDLSPYQHMHVWEPKHRHCLDFDARLAAQAELGFIIKDAVIKEALLQKIAEHDNIHLFSSATVTGLVVNEEDILVSSANHRWQGRFLMAADGGDSPTRTLLNIPIKSRPYHQHALIATVSTEKPHQQTAWQVFNPNGPLAFLPLKDPKQCSIVWSLSPEEALRHATSSDEAFEQDISQAFAHKLGQVKLLSKRFHFPLVMRHTERYTGGRWLLLGDAAHTIHPLAGLGLNLGLEDVASCLALLKAEGSPQFSQGMLASFHRERKRVVSQTIALLDAIQFLFSTKSAPLIGLRNLGLSVFNRFTPLKRFIIEQAK